MTKEIIITADGSTTIEIPAQHVTYHSRHGAASESLHVYIDAGFKHWHQQAPPNLRCRIFEMGLGTGLNALLTAIEAGKLQRPISYHAIESSPLEPAIMDQLNYCQQLDRPDMHTFFHQLHTCPWEKEIALTPNFTFKKSNSSLQQFSTTETFHIIYYDAFAPRAQPELWTKEIFEKIYQMLLPGALLVTYCSKSDVRRAMEAAGFKVEKIPGPRGKREMVRAGRQ